MTSSTWRTVDGGPRWRSFLALALAVTAGLGWLGWPLWSSLTVPTRAQLDAEHPFVLAAVLALTALVGVAGWLDAGRRMDFLTPLTALVVLGVAARLWLSPGVNGIEPVFFAPLLAGVVLGAPLGWVAGVATMALSALAGGQVTSALAGQAIVLGLWGAAGGLLHRVRTPFAWPTAAALCLLLGPASGLVLNLIGWASDDTTITTPFVPGLGPLETLRRLWTYTLETSLAYDLVRGATNALAVALLGLPLLRALRTDVWAPPWDGRPDAALPPTLSPAAQIRRERSDTIGSLWEPRKDTP